MDAGGFTEGQFIFQGLFSVKKAQNDLGFEPLFSLFAYGLYRAIYFGGFYRDKTVQT
jgi:hypothetical protein